jgi:uncharacterized membrane protein
VNKRLIYALIAVAMLINLVLSIVIQSQKSAKESGVRTLGECFDGTGGCATVQMSYYARTLGISNPYYGIVFFALWALMFYAMSLPSKAALHISSWKQLHMFLAVSLIAGALFSIWLLYVQFFILRTTCIYCLWVDAIMIACAALFVGMHRRELQLPF